MHLRTPVHPRRWTPTTPEQTQMKRRLPPGNEGGAGESRECHEPPVMCVTVQKSVRWRRSLATRTKSLLRRGRAAAYHDPESQSRTQSGARSSGERTNPRRETRNCPRCSGTATSASSSDRYTRENTRGVTPFRPIRGFLRSCVLHTQTHAHTHISTPVAPPFSSLFHFSFLHPPLLRSSFVPSVPSVERDPRGFASRDCAHVSERNHVPSPCVFFSFFEHTLVTHCSPIRGG